MAWLSRNNVAPTDSLTADMLNSLANDIRFWGGDVNAGGYKLTNVILSGSGGFERTPSPAVIAPVAAGGSSEVQLSDYVAGSPDTFPPRWKMAKAAQPTPDFSIERYNEFGSLIDKPLSIRMADGIVVLKAQQWTGPVNAEGQTISNVNIGSGSSIPWDAVVGEPASFPPGPHTHAAADTVSGVFAVARLGSGTPSASNYLRGDGVWSTVAQQTPWTSDVDAARHSLLNAERVVALGDGGLITAMDFNINRDVNGNRLMAGPAALFRVDAANSNIFMALYPNGAAGTAVSDPSFPLNFRPGVRMGIGAWNLTKTEVDSPYFHVPRIVQPGDMYHAWNLSDEGGQWKHLAAGYGNIITSSMGDGNLRIYTSTSGAAGAVASLKEVAFFGPGSVRFAVNAVYVNGASAAANAWHIFAPWDNAYSSRFASGMTNDTSRYFVARYNDSGVWIDDPISINRATGVVTITTLDKASLGTGTADSTKYLRGDGVWAIPPGGAGGGQTPWVSDIDGAGFRLTNTGNIILNAFGQAGTTEYLAQHGIFFRPGFADGSASEADRRNVSITTGRGSTNQWGDAIDINGFHHISFFTGGVERMRVDGAAPTLKFSAGSYLKIDLDGNDLWGEGIESGASYTKMPSGYAHRWYFGNPDGGASDVMQLSVTTAPRLELNGWMYTASWHVFPISQGVAFNADLFGGSWRYINNGPAGLITTQADFVKIYGQASGAAGAVFDPNVVVNFNHQDWFHNTPIKITGVWNQFAGSGAGLEIGVESGTTCHVHGYNRSNSSYLDVLITGSVVGLNPLAGYANIAGKAYLNFIPNDVGTKLALYGNPGNGTGYGFGIEGGTMWATVDVNAQHRWYVGNAPDGGGSCYMELNRSHLFTKSPIMMKIVQGMNDGFGRFNTEGNCAYLFFDSATKKMTLRYHETGVAYRSYTLKEGDQGPGTLLWADYAPAGNPNSFNPGSGGAMTIGTRAVGDVLQFTTDVSWTSAAGTNKQFGLRLGAVDTYYATYAPTGAAGGNFSITVTILSTTQYRIDAVTCPGWTISGVGSTVTYTGGLAGLGNQVYILLRCTGGTNAITRNIQTIYRTN